MEHTPLLPQASKGVAKARPETRPLELRSPRQLLMAALFLGWCVDWFFFDKVLGIAWPLFVVMICFVLWRVCRFEAVQSVRRNNWLFAPLLFFALMVFVRANSFVTTLNVLGTLALLSYIVFFYAAGKVEALDLPGVFLLPFRVSGASLYKGAPVVSESEDVKRLHTTGRRNLFPVLRGALLAIPALIVFGALLAAADLVFADYLDEFLHLGFMSEVMERLWRGTLILMATWLLLGGFVIALGRKSDQDEQGTLEKMLGRLPRIISLGFTETATILILVNGLFLAFTLVQFAYLFGGTANINTAGYTYSEYARRGFFELVAAAILALALILGLNWLARRESKKQIGFFNTQSSLTIGFVLVMLISAFRRMRLYEAAYGYTELRLYVYVFMVWLALLLGWFLMTLWRRPDRFAIGFIIAAMGYLVTLNLINPDAFIAGQNLARYRHTNDLDVAYLTTLSDDAVAQLTAALTLVAGDEQLVTTPACAFYWQGDLFQSVDRSSEECEDTPSRILAEELAGRLQKRQTDTSWRRWQSFHLSRWRAFSLLEQLEIR